MTFGRKEEKDEDEGWRMKGKDEGGRMKGKDEG
jgi:hypothetical protein